MISFDYPGALYHVAACGNDRSRIFHHTVEDRQRLLDVLGEMMRRRT
jgi:hypothetical protein